MLRHKYALPAALLLCAIVIVIAWLLSTRQPHPSAAPPQTATSATGATAAAPASSSTRIHAHNLLLQKGPDFRVYVTWLDGTLARTRLRVNPSFDNPDSFYLSIETGVIRANIGDIGNYLNASVTDSPLKNIKLNADGQSLKLTGTLHKLIPLPVQVVASVAATTDNRVRIHIEKIDVLKVPVKALLHLFHVSTADLVKTNTDGIEVQGNDVLLDPAKVLPAPHIRGKLTQVSVKSPDIQAVFGNASHDLGVVEQWRNFFSLKGGSIDFGNLTMHPVNLIMIDLSKNPWFDLDLVNYRDQFTNGYTRMTADSGLQIFIPDRRDVSKPVSTSDSIQWFKDRNIPPPAQIVQSAK